MKTCTILMLCLFSLAACARTPPLPRSRGIPPPATADEIRRELEEEVRELREQESEAIARINSVNNPSGPIIWHSTIEQNSTDEVWLAAILSQKDRLLVDAHRKKWIRIAFLELSLLSWWQPIWPATAISCDG